MGIWSNSVLMSLHSLRRWLVGLVMVIPKRSLHYHVVAFMHCFVLHLFMLEDKHRFKFGGVISGFYIYLERSISA